LSSSQNLLLADESEMLGSLLFYHLTNFPKVKTPNGVVSGS